MGALTEEIPKPMIPFSGIPFLQYLLYYLRQQGFTRFVIPTAYLGEKIREYFGNGAGFGIHIAYVDSTIEAESGGSFVRSLPLVEDDVFMMQYGDAFIPCDYKEMIDIFLASGKTAMMACNVRPKDEQHKNNIIVDEHNNILGVAKGDAQATLHDAGALFVKKNIATYVEKLGKKDFKLTELVPLLIQEKEIIAYPLPVLSRGIGGPDKIARFEKFLQEEKLIEPVKNWKKD